MAERNKSDDERWDAYLFEYSHEGHIYGFTIKAPSAEDARARLLRLPDANYCGVVQMTIPVEMGVFAKLYCWWRNWRRR